ncbi:hypothetical protein XENTR_v10007036 [Xenopus tropicalis]|nr:hypothetical protein XENTR_v10007036 [Xenopus tropicalis]KAE8627533.1 hypothetical protein XENTR_v10007036 [Xenopus tropicalis]KAE8627534.1 hypothetical protein XENTR_v10007036 [Xenopus tropicalis]KAE8627535.1 hypothetical protein XENTR_v10007036 [Xenopus tropicalis]
MPSTGSNVNCRWESIRIAAGHSHLFFLLFLLPNLPCSRIACISAPSIYQKVRGLARESLHVQLLEYDQRFAIYGDDFVFYDYNEPLKLPESLEQSSFDIVIADPPYLSEECLRNTAQTIKYLSRGKIILCTGAIMEDLAAQILGLKICKFIPKHTRSLANEFRCYSNYELTLDRLA